ncbi:hypothetical protein ACLOJK_006402 [Asimina triloba]
MSAPSMQTTAVVVDVVDVAADLDQMTMVIDHDEMGEDGGSGAVAAGGAGRWCRRIRQQGRSITVISGDGCRGLDRFEETSTCSPSVVIVARGGDVDGKGRWRRRRAVAASLTVADASGRWL